MQQAIKQRALSAALALLSGKSSQPCRPNLVPLAQLQQADQPAMQTWRQHLDKRNADESPLSDLAGEHTSGRPQKRQRIAAHPRNRAIVQRQNLLPHQENPLQYEEADGRPPRRKRALDDYLVGDPVGRRAKRQQVNAKRQGQDPHQQPGSRGQQATGRPWRDSSPAELQRSTVPSAHGHEQTSPLHVSAQHAADPGLEEGGTSISKPASSFHRENCEASSQVQATEGRHSRHKRLATSLIDQLGNQQNAARQDLPELKSLECDRQQAVLQELVERLEIRAAKLALERKLGKGAEAERKATPSTAEGIAGCSDKANAEPPDHLACLAESRVPTMVDPAASDEHIMVGECCPSSRRPRCACR